MVQHLTIIEIECYTKGTREQDVFTHYVELKIRIQWNWPKVFHNEHLLSHCIISVYTEV